MARKFLNHRGFTAVEALLIILVLAIIGCGGYYVWHTQHKAKPAVQAKVTSSGSVKSPAKSTAPPSNTLTLDKGAVAFTIPTGWSGAVDSPTGCQESIGSPVTEDNDCVASAEVTLHSSAQAPTPLTALVSVYTLKDLSATPQHWFESDMQETQAVPAEGDITSHDPINGQPSYYLEQNVSPAYIDENYVIISKNLVVYVYSRVAYSNSNVPSTDYDYTKYVPDIKQLTDSIEIN